MKIILKIRVSLPVLVLCIVVASFIIHFMQKYQENYGIYIGYSLGLHSIFCTEVIPLRAVFSFPFCLIEV